MSEACDISVIVPCYNANRYLNICLESLKAQRVPNIEMIFIDDGSTDSTGAILDAFARAESRARVVQTKAFPPRAIGAFRWQRGGILRSWMLMMCWRRTRCRFCIRRQ